jgi:hypothetical protein
LIAALRARNLERGFGFACIEGAADVVSVMPEVNGFVRCASFSVTALSVRGVSGCWYAGRCSVICGGLVSWTCGMPLEMDVSGAPRFRGGGGGTLSREYG